MAPAQLGELAEVMGTLNSPLLMLLLSSPQL